MLTLLLLFPGIPILAFAILAFVVASRKKRERVLQVSSGTFNVPARNIAWQLLGIAALIIAVSIGLLKLIHINPELGLLVFKGMLACFALAIYIKHKKTRQQ